MAPNGEQEDQLAKFDSKDFLNAKAQVSRNQLQNSMTANFNGFETSKCDDRISMMQANDSLHALKVAKSYNITIDEASKLFNQSSSQFIPETGLESIMKGITQFKKADINESSIGTLDASQIPIDFYVTPIDLNESKDALLSVWGNTIIIYRDQKNLDKILQIDDKRQRFYSVKFFLRHPYCSVGCENGKGILVDLEKQKPIRYFGCVSDKESDRINCMDIKISTIASGYNNGTVSLSDIREKPNVFQTHDNLHSDAHVCSLKWNKSKEPILASGGADSNCFILDQRQSTSQNDHKRSIYTKQYAKLAGHSSSIKGLAWNPKLSSIIATGGGIHDNMLNIWNIGEKPSKPIISANSKAQISAIFWPSSLPGCIFTFHGASEVSRGDIKIWDICIDSRSIELSSTIKGHSSRITTGVCSNSTNQCATLGSDRTLKIWQFLPNNIDSENVEPCFLSNMKNCI